MRISTSLLFTQGLRAITDQQVSVARAQQQVATGKRILTPADDPAGAKRLLDLDQSLALTRQFTRNADTATNRLALEDTALGGAGNVLQRVRELAVQAGNGALVDADRVALAEEVQGRLGELLGLANTRDGNNEYVFAGTATQTRPFSHAGGAFSYDGDQGERELQIGAGYQVRIGDTGAEVFMAVPSGNGVYAAMDDPGNTGTGVLDPGSVTDRTAWVPDDYSIDILTPSTYEVRDGGGALVVAGAYASGEPIAFNGGIEILVKGAPATGDRFTVSPSTSRPIFDTVQDLATALRTPVVSEADSVRLSNALTRSLQDLDQSLDNVDTIRARVGARLNAVENEKQINESFEVHLAQVHSQIQDLDLAEGITRLTQHIGSLEAAQASFGRIQGLSLFDYLR